MSNFWPFAHGIITRIPAISVLCIFIGAIQQVPDLGKGREKTKKETANYIERMVCSQKSDVPQTSSSTSISEITISYGDIPKYTDICFQRASRICSSWAWRIDAVQIFFLASNRKILAGKFVKWFGRFVRFMAVLREHIIFNIKWDEVRKMSEVFWAKLYSTMSDLFC